MNNRALLTREQIQMYEMLGLSVSNFAEVSQEPINIESENDQEFEEIAQEDEVPDDQILSSPDSSYSKDYNNELVNGDNISPLKNIAEYEEYESEVQVPKKPYLKRGSGLTSRFRIPPDAFNLKKLPKYKYADRIRKNLAKNELARKVLVKESEKEVHKEPVQKVLKEPVKQVLKEPPKELLKSKPEFLKKQMKSGSSEETSILIPPKNVVLKIKPITEDPQPQLQEWFHSRFKENQSETLETPKNSKFPKGVSWAQILSSHNIMDSPVKVDHLLTPETYGDAGLSESGLFHLLEDRVNNMSLDASMTSLMKLISSLQKPQELEDEEKTLVDPEDPIIDDRNSVNFQLQPHPNEINKKIIIDDTTTEDEEEDHRVRFADDVEIADETSDLSTDVEAIELSQTSTPNERKNFHEFKRKFLGNKVQVQSDDLKEKSELLRQKLLELEAEILSLRQQNANANKFRHDLDIDRRQLENDREDMLEKIKDDRIKMELQLHDERLKVEQEKQKLEKMQKNPSKKEREEIAKLKEMVGELKEELKTKDTRHGSTSARYRSQIKVLEKDNQSLRLELDVVKKDTKKLEFENARLRKDTNNKMLQEINRNIAKLAPAEVAVQPDLSKKSVTRKSEPTMKKRVKSVPELHTRSDTDTSDDETYSSRKSRKENNPVKVRRSDPVRTTSVSSEVLSDMKREIINADGSKDIWYPNGNLKKISPDGMLIRMLYFNKDIKETNIHEGTVKYYYNEKNTWHTTYVDGLEILEYPE